MLFATKQLFKNTHIFAFLYNNRALSTRIPTAENKISVGDLKINCLQTGSGEHNVLCLPGAFGTIWTDFSPQITGFDLTKFSLLVWEPPGYGKSRPPKRCFSLDYLERDADVAFKLLKTVDVNRCSLLGWSDGGITAIFIAAKYPDIVDKLIVWGSNAYMTDADIHAIEKIRDISNWSPAMRSTMTNIYGTNELKDMVNAWVEFSLQIRKIDDGKICNHILPQIEAPTLILHGNKDPLVPEFHADYLHKNIPTSILHKFQDGKHNIHLKYAELFNTLVQSFLLQKSSKL